MRNGRFLDLPLTKSYWRDGISPLLFMIALPGIYNDWDWGDIKKVGLGLVLGMVPAILIIISRSTTIFIVYCLGFLFLLYAAKVKPSYIY